MLFEDDTARIATIVLADGTSITGTSFGAERSISGELCFSTNSVGYPESLTDPSFSGQILVLVSRLMEPLYVAGLMEPLYVARTARRSTVG